VGQGGDLGAKWSKVEQVERWSKWSKVEQVEQGGASGAVERWSSGAVEQVEQGGASGARWSKWSKVEPVEQVEQGGDFGQKKTRISAGFFGLVAFGYSVLYRSICVELFHKSLL
jgi:hypothetical protein